MWFEMVPVILYLMVGAFSLVMAYKCIFSKKFITFHEKAAGKPWEDIDGNLQAVILTLMRVSGFGFLMVALMLLGAPMVNHYRPDVFLRFGIPMMAVVYCSGLFWANYRLHQKTGASTPWKGALLAIVLLVTGMAISSLHI